MDENENQNIEMTAIQVQPKPKAASVRSEYRSDNVFWIAMLLLHEARHPGYIEQKRFRLADPSRPVDQSEAQSERAMRQREALIHRAEIAKLGHAHKRKVYWLVAIALTNGIGWLLTWLYFIST